MVNLKDVQYIKLKIKRRNSPQEASYWQDFQIPYRPNMNIVSVLMEIRKNRWFGSVTVWRRFAAPAPC